MPELDVFSRLAAALAIGLLVGIERGWKTREVEDHKRAAGVRTFGLAGLMGGTSGVLSAELGPMVVAVTFLAFAATLGAFVWMESRASGDLSATGLVAGLLTFLLGTMATVGDVTVAIAVAVCMTVLLALREKLHSWLFRLTWDEVRAGLILMVMTFLLLPLLPNRPIDPWGAVNLYEVWLLAILMALISFIGYVAVRMLGGTWGIVLTAAAGGLASSTATTLAFARLAGDQPRATDLLVGGIFISGAVMALRVAGLVLILNPALLASLFPELGMVVLGMLCAAGLSMLRLRSASPVGAGASLVIANPLAVASSIKIALFIVVVMASVEIVQLLWGQSGVLGVAALSGILDVDAITLSMAQSGRAAQLAADAIVLAVVVNTIAKSVMSAWVGGAGVGLRVGLPSLAVVVATGAVRFWVG
ncbi:MgtC/SapB family protein [Paragemmobacter straminiformis]|uniref:MgtC/SapB family protein n=1 Tax=Paragemmobacter straminiformis TaxID=2045119 RepID=A0A842I9L1_9RHOB|nr:DUF4010 domain-containing protein [Gemmobacter straminiformis]MBC2836530.1 MgtC/SapB family protein [Gemmobacter straminiformis]